MDYMSDGEIIAFYRQAADRRKQIGILADLNATTKETITWILKRAGALNSSIPVLKKSPPPSYRNLLHLCMTKVRKKFGVEAEKENR